MSQDNSNVLHTAFESLDEPRHTADSVPATWDDIDGSDLSLY